MSETDKPPNPAAFPNPPISSGFNTTVFQEGMSLRDWFAGQAINGLIDHEGIASHLNADIAARNAYMLADAMLQERSK
jgi:hypothetical protein